MPSLCLVEVADKAERNTLYGTTIVAATDARRTVRPVISFRVFVSFTFRDLTMERNALQERVWPRLRIV